MDLKTSGEIELERLKAQLHAEALIANIRHSTLYEKAADALIGLHRRLDDAHAAVVDYTAVVETAEIGPRALRRKEVERTMNDFREYFRQNKIFLPRVLASSVRDLESYLYATAQQFLDGVENAPPGTHPGIKNLEWIKIHADLLARVRPLLEALEEQLRRMLGINTMFSDVAAQQVDEPTQLITNKSEK
jgi:hypothetical protein